MLTNLVAQGWQTQFDFFSYLIDNNLETCTQLGINSKWRFVIDGWGLLKFGSDFASGWLEADSPRPLTAQVKVNISKKWTTWLVVLVNSLCTLDVRQKVRCFASAVKWSMTNDLSSLVRNQISGLITASGQVRCANSKGFSNAVRSSRMSVSCSVLFPTSFENSDRHQSQPAS